MATKDTQEIIRLKEASDRLFKASVAFHGAVASETVTRAVAEEMYAASINILSQIQPFFEVKAPEKAPAEVPPPVTEQSELPLAEEKPAKSRKKSAKSAKSTEKEVTEVPETPELPLVAEVTEAVLPKAEAKAKKTSAKKTTAKVSDKEAKTTSKKTAEKKVAKDAPAEKAAEKETPKKRASKKATKKT